jgi:hypothetical protein
MRAAEFGQAANEDCLELVHLRVTAYMPESLAVLLAQGIYIGGGALVLILIIVVVLLLMRRP